MITFLFKITYMKKHLILSALMFLPTLTMGQSIFEKYQNNKEVTAISISPKMFHLLGSMSLSSGDPDADALMEMIGGITRFKALITGTLVISDDIAQWVKTEASEKGLDMMVTIQESDANLNVYVKEGENEGELESLLMFSKGISNALPEAKLQGSDIEAVVLLIEGKIALDKIAKLITKMNLPGGEQLKKAGI